MTEFSGNKVSLNEPSFHDVGIIALVPDHWGGVWTLRHQVLTRLSKYFHVVWMNPARGWRDYWLKGEGNAFHDSKRKFHHDVNFAVYDPGRWLPLFYRPRALANLTHRSRLQRAARILKKRGCSKIAIYVWRPEYGSALDVLTHDLSIYHIDDEYTFSDTEKPIDDQELKLIHRVNQVIIHSKKLLEKKGGINPNTILIPNGVDYYSYEKQYEEPEDMRLIAHPRIGYVGVVKKQLNLQLMSELARSHPEWSFVFVGPIGNIRGKEVVLAELEKMPNVSFLGNKPVELLPAYTQHLDICMMCYELNDYTQYIYPLKLHEYLASGRPVISSPVQSVLEFQKVVSLATTAEEWTTGIRNALKKGPSTPMEVEERRRIARNYDWGRLVRKLACTICSRIDPKYLEQLYDDSERMNGSP